MTEAFRLGFMSKMAELQKESQLLRLSDAESSNKINDYTNSDEWKSKASDPAFWTETTRLGEQGAAARRASGATQPRPGVATARTGAQPYSRPRTPVPLTEEQRTAESEAFKKKWGNNPSIKWHSRDEYDEGLNPVGTVPVTSPAPEARPATRPSVAPAARPAAAPAAPSARPVATPATNPAVQPRKFKVVYDSKTGSYRRADPNNTTPWTDRERRGIVKLHKDKGRTTPIVW